MTAKAEPTNPVPVPYDINYLTVLDHFAIAALQALPGHEFSHDRQAATRAYQIAQECMQERARIREGKQ